MPFRALSSPEGDDPLPSALRAATFPKGEGIFAAAPPSFAPALRYGGPRVSARIRCFGADTPGGVSLRGKRETITTQPRLAAPRMGFAAVVTWVQRWEQAPPYGLGGDITAGRFVTRTGFLGRVTAVSGGGTPPLRWWECIVQNSKCKMQYCGVPAGQLDKLEYVE